MTSKALRLIDDNQWADALQAARQSKDPLVMTLYNWQRFQSDEPDLTYKDLKFFLTTYPDWPATSAIKAQLEKTIDDVKNPVEVIAWFTNNPPITPEGFISYAAALQKTGDTQKLKSVVGTWWATTLMSPNDQRYIYGLYKAHIPLEAHRRRFDKLLFNKQYSNARAVAEVLGTGYPELAEARIALAAQKPNVNSYISKVPPSLQSDPGLLYERLTWRRKNDLDIGAMEILHNPPPADKIINPEDWWRERHIMIRRLLEDGKYESAYLLAIKHVQKDGFAYAQAQWIAGWLALTFMDKPAEAYQRFESMKMRVSTPVSKARASYWAGRAAESLRAEALAKMWYTRAAQYQTVFYGQKAGEKIGAADALKNAAPPALTQADITQFDQNLLIRAALLYNKAGLDRRSSQFLWAFIKAEHSPKAYRYAAEKAAELGRYQDVIRIAKEATKQGLFLTLQSYPVILPAMENADQRAEWALLHSLIRQESQFDTKAQSPAGALGLMQLMPTTATIVAKQKNIPHDTAWLTQNPAHNIALGSRYFADLVERFDGSYIMAAAGYNAGPGRVDRWIKQFGDPRKGEIDWIDWIELMPIYETRNYVQRVMEGLYVYRLRLGNKNRAMPTTLAYNNR